MEAQFSTEMYGDFQCSTLRYTPENKTYDHHRGEWPAQAPRVLLPMKYIVFSDSVTLLDYFVHFTHIV